MGNREQADAGGLACKVDYLEFTVPGVALYDVLALVGSDLQPLDRGWRGYTSSGLVAGGLGRLGWHEDPERAERMGVHCSLGSQALAHLAALEERWGDVGSVLGELRAWGGHVTRLDLAWDDRARDRNGGLLDLDVMQEALDRGEYTSRWRGGRSVRGFGSEAGGHTIYMGSPRSDTFLRTYDKRAERIARGHAEQVDGVGHWVRVELQLRRERAQAAALLLEGAGRDRRGVMRHLAGVLLGYVQFRERSDTDTNKARWPVARWWARFLGHVERARLWVERIARTVADVKDWLSRTVAPSLAIIEVAMGKRDGWAWLFAEADAGRARWGPRHRAILAASRAG